MFLDIRVSSSRFRRNFIGINFIDLKSNKSKFLKLHGSQQLSMNSNGAIKYCTSMPHNNNWNKCQMLP